MQKLKIGAPGYFAENLSVAGLDEAQLQVGDVLSIGEEAQLKVSGPRVPCFKLCWHMGQPDTFIREFRPVREKRGVF